MRYDVKKVNEFVDVMTRKCSSAEVHELALLLAYDQALDLSRTITNPAKLMLLEVWEEMSKRERAAVLFDLGPRVDVGIRRVAIELSEQASKEDDAEVPK